jgi:mono/diheme cytochrome c family protein
MSWGLLVGVLLPAGMAVSAAAASPQPRDDAFVSGIVPLLDRYCFACHGGGKHKGDVRLDGWKDQGSAVADRQTWERVLQKVQAREMPPEDRRQPSSRERARVVAWIETQVLHCDCKRPDPGRVTVRRLNRVEYNHTVRDLLGVDFRPADDFPVDDSGYGFDTIGDALSVPPVLIEKYLVAARRIIDLAFGPGEVWMPQTNRYPVDLLEVGYNAKQRGDGWAALNSIEEDDVAVREDAPRGGEFMVRVKAYARQESARPMLLTFMLGATPVHMVEVETNAAAPRVYEARLAAPPGRPRLRAVVRRLKDGLSEAEALKWKSGVQQKGAVLVEYMEVLGPLPPTDSSKATQTPSRQWRLPPEGAREQAAEFLRRFASRAFRRPVTGSELARLLDLADTVRTRCATMPGTNAEPAFASAAGSCWEDGLRVALQAILVSPHFLFRGELQPDPDDPESVHPIDEYALASRLSYFMWSSMPDEELFALAGKGRLRRDLAGQVRRMLRDPRTHALVENFGGQWLQLRNLDLAAPDARTFPAFNDRLRASMRRETELFFEYVLREDRSALEFLTADYTFVNPILARHYGLPEASAAGADDPEEFRRVSLRGTPRRGVLTQGSILLITSNPTRTSPVKRGKWVLDNLLGTPPPPPPPNVPELKEGRELTGTLRERMEQHRADPLCASCHARLDPIGFGLENFDGTGRWRSHEGQALIDASGRLATGEAFQGAEALTRLLAETKQEQFLRCLADKLLTYALGRGLEYYDKCALDEICRRAARHGNRMSSLITEVVKSVPFQMRRGDAGTSPVAASRGSGGRTQSDP